MRLFISILGLLVAQQSFAAITTNQKYQLNNQMGPVAHAVQLGSLLQDAGAGSTLADGKIFVGNSSGVAAAVTPSGDVTVTNAGVTAIGSGKVTSTMILNGTIVDADINASAAIADTKLATISTAGKVSGSAITSGTIGGTTVISTTGAATVDSLVVTTSATPLAADACTAGKIVWDADYIYVCTASGVWKRAALTGGY